jgi:hypothetical protein
MFSFAKHLQCLEDRTSSINTCSMNEKVVEILLLIIISK